MNSIENKNLQAIMNFVQDYGKKIPQEYLDILNVELAYSTLICPFADENSIQLMCHESNPDEMFIPSFTSLDDYFEFFNDYEYEPHECDFLSLKSSISDDLTGIMINPATDNFFIDCKQLDEIEAIDFPESDFHDIKKSDFKQYLESLNENGLVDNINPADFIDDYDSDHFKNFLEKLQASGLLVLFATSERIKGSPKDNIYQTKRLKELGFYSMVNHGGFSNFLAFSDEKSAFDEKSHKMHNDKFFISPMSFPNLVKYVLEMDADGIIINHSTKPIFLNRNLLIREIDNILKISKNPEIESFSKYSKKLK